MNTQFKELNSEITISDENGNMTERKSYQNNEEILALENLIEETHNEQIKLNKSLYPSKKEKTKERIKYCAFILIAGIVLGILDYLLAPTQTYISIEILEWIFRSSMYAMIILPICNKNEKYRIEKQIAEVKLNELKYTYDLEKQLAKAKVKQKEPTDNIITSTYEFNHNVLNNCSYKYYDINKKEKELFKLKTKTK